MDRLDKAASGHVRRQSKRLRPRNVAASPARNVPRSPARIILGPSVNNVRGPPPAGGIQPAFRAVPPSNKAETDPDSDSDSDDEKPPVKATPTITVRSSQTARLSGVLLKPSTTTTTQQILSTKRPVTSQKPATTSRVSQVVAPQQTSSSSSSSFSSSVASSTTSASATSVAEVKQSSTQKTGTAVVPSSTSVDAGLKEASPTPEEVDEKRQGRLNPGAEAGIIVGVLSFIIILAIILFSVRRCRRRRSNNQPPTARILSDRMISAPMPVQRQSDAMTVNVGYYDAANRRPSMVQEPQSAYFPTPRNGESQYFQRRVFAEPTPEMAEGAAERSQEPTHFI